MNERRIPAEVFPPGEFLSDELDARDWTQTDLAEIIGRDVSLVNDIIRGKRGITPETAQGLADAFDNTPQYWLNLDAAYRLSQVERADDDVVSRKARLYAKAPVREMIRRHWIEDTKSIDVLEQQVLDFFQVSDLDDDFHFAHAARKSTSDPPTPAQNAWLCRGRRLASAVHTDAYSKHRLPELIAELRALAEAPENVSLVPALLATYGIRFLLIEPLEGTRIDGAAFWLDKDTPVIVLSLRYDRIDHFWHTLMHEIAHLIHEDGDLLDQEIVQDKDSPMNEKPDYEERADDFACDALIPAAQMERFIARIRPLFSAARVQAFAIRMKVHAGIVAGQLQHRHEIKYANLRRMLTPVRSILAGVALTDGWGSQLPLFMQE